MKAAPTVAEPKTTGHDVRVDRVGYVEDLVELWSDPLRKAVKLKMVDQELVLLEGDVYEGKLSATTSTWIDAAKFYKLFKAGKIKEKDFIAAITVSKKEAAAFLSPRDLEAISAEAPGSPRFAIARKKGIDVTLAQVIASINAAAIVTNPELLK